jgi:hypothetical protein
MLFKKLVILATTTTTTKPFISKQVGAG